MKINETQRLGALNPYRNSNEQRMGGTGNRGRKHDEITISNEAKELLGTQSAVNPERSKKLESLKESVTTGTYYIDSNKIAEKLLPYFKRN
jgi:negative regulator of flagellin synthesis FlgM